MPKSFRLAGFGRFEQLIYCPDNPDPSGAPFEIFRRKPLLGF